jgi:hypothetical protein
MDTFPSPAALRVIHRLVLRARMHAYQERDYKTIADLLDSVEYLVDQCVKGPAGQQVFERHLATWATHESNMQGLLDQYRETEER